MRLRAGGCNRGAAVPALLPPALPHPAFLHCFRCLRKADCWRLQPDPWLHITQCCRTQYCINAGARLRSSSWSLWRPRDTPMPTWRVRAAGAGSGDAAQRAEGMSHSALPCMPQHARNPTCCAVTCMSLCVFVRPSCTQLVATCPAAAAKGLVPESSEQYMGT